MATRIAVFALLNCVFAAPLIPLPLKDDYERYDSFEDEPLSNMQLLIPIPVDEGRDSGGSSAVNRAPSGDSDEYWHPEHPFSKIPAESFTLDETARLLTEDLPQQPKKTVKKDLSRQEETFPRAPRVQESNEERDNVDTDYQMERCERLLNLLVKSTDPLGSGKLRPSELRSLCLLHMKYNSNNVFRTNRNVLKRKKPSSPVGFLSTLLGGDRPLEGDGVEELLDVSGNNWKGQLGNLAINGQGGYVRNLGVGGKGRDVGNLAVGGKGGQYGNLGIGGQGSLFGNLAIGGGGGAYDDTYFPKDAWSNQYQNGLLTFLLGDDGHGGNMFSSGPVAKDVPKITLSDVSAPDFPETNSVPQQNAPVPVAVPLQKELDNFESDHKGRLFNNFDKNGYGRLLGSSLQPQSVVPSQDVAKDRQAQDKTLRDQKSVARDLCKNDERCGSLLLGGTGGLVGNLAIDGRGYDAMRWLQSPLRVVALALMNAGSNASSGDRPVLLKQLKYPTRREWDVIGSDKSKILRQYISKSKPWLVL